ncbi:hypothetical protein GFS60_01758 [Rhodococcus sp. WAY2]|nr:hypothetical protein GFS60_01758 [Rhodococcus sp. WAY2]
MHSPRHAKRPGAGHTGRKRRHSAGYETATETHPPTSSSCVGRRTFPDFQSHPRGDDHQRSWVEHDLGWSSNPA